MAAPTVGIRADTKAPLRKEETERLNAAMVQSLDSFLDELAEGHRRRMEEVVQWLTNAGSLDDEIRATVDVLSPLFQKWSLEICFLLRMHDPMRFTALKRDLRGIGSRTLSQRLKHLEAQSIVERRVYPEVPVRVEYRLTGRGLKMADLFMPVVAHLRISALRDRAARK